MSSSIFSQDEIDNNRLAQFYESCKMIVETYCETGTLESIIGREKTKKICDLAREIMREIEDLYKNWDSV